MIKYIAKHSFSVFKILFVISVMIAAMAGFIASINEAKADSSGQNHAPIRNVTVTGDNITLGDVFTNIDQNADFVLAPSPLPDTSLIWDARTLNRIARAFNLGWRPSSASDQIRIRRIATVIDESMLEKAILQSFDAGEVDKGIDLEFIGANPQVILPHEIEPSVTVISSSYNHSSQTFTATLRTADNVVRNFSGVGHRLVSIPVLRVPLKRGDRITKSMITTMPMREAYITEDMILREDELLGMTPRKIVSSNTPILLSELAKPIMIERGDLVNTKLENGPINISAMAKALERGTKGDIIRVMNMDSKKTLEVQVTGLREARVF